MFGAVSEARRDRQARGRMLGHRLRIEDVLDAYEPELVPDTT